MKLKELKEILSSNQSKSVLLYVGEELVPPQFHITEIGKEVRNFVDCGGTKRKFERCVLQVWVANDTEHRLDSTKMLKIVELGKGVIEDYDIEVYFEYEKDTVSLYPVRSHEVNESIRFYLGNIHTACLAPEKCGVECCSPQVITLSIK